MTGDENSYYHLAARTIGTGTTRANPVRLPSVDTQQRRSHKSLADLQRLPGNVLQRNVREDKRSASNHDKLSRQSTAGRNLLLSRDRRPRRDGEQPIQHCDRHHPPPATPNQSDSSSSASLSTKGLFPFRKSDQLDTMHRRAAAPKSNTPTTCPLKPHEPSPSVARSPKLVSAPMPRPSKRRYIDPSPMD